jgi:hypothetical protein
MQPCEHDPLYDIVSSQAELTNLTAYLHTHPYQFKQPYSNPQEFTI